MFSYALVTLFMLVMLEVQMVHRRIGDLRELRSNMQKPEQRVLCWRPERQEWSYKSSYKLYSGDLVALTNPVRANVGFLQSEEPPAGDVPCDLAVSCLTSLFI